jgi:hypothetical protein
VLTFGAEKLGLFATFLNVTPPALDFGFVAYRSCLPDRLYLGFAAGRANDNMLLG